MDEDRPGRDGPPAEGRRPSDLHPLAPRRVLARLRGSLTRDNLLASTALDRAERVLDTLDRAASTLERVARVELAIVERLLPIVEDLGELVRHELDDARRRRASRGQPPLPRAPRRPVDPIDPDVIDIDP